jgi:serine phosphatase RsbU (regulator of sigma subunit)
VLYCTITPTSSGFGLTVTAGGHPLPIVRRADRRSETVGESGSLLGPLDEPRVTTVYTDLRPNDVVVLYTDGLTDVPPPHNLSSEALTSLIERAADGIVTADVVATCLGQEIEARLAFPSRDDDIALVVLKVDKRAGSTR